jgi:hypothetical protein
VDEHDCALDPVTFVEALARVLSHRTPDQLHSSLTSPGRPKSACIISNAWRTESTAT